MERFPKNYVYSKYIGVIWAKWKRNVSYYTILELCGDSRKENAGHYSILSYMGIMESGNYYRL